MTDIRPSTVSRNLDITKQNGKNGTHKEDETNVSEQTMSEIDEMTIRIHLKEKQRFTSATFAQKTGIDLLLKDDERRKQRIANDFIMMLLKWKVVKQAGERTEGGSWIQLFEDTKKRGRKLMVYEVVAPFDWTLQIGGEE